MDTHNDVVIIQLEVQACHWLIETFNAYIYETLKAHNHRISYLYALLIVLRGSLHLYAKSNVVEYELGSSSCLNIFEHMLDTGSRIVRFDFISFFLVFYATYNGILGPAIIGHFVFILTNKKSLHCIINYAFALLPQGDSKTVIYRLYCS